MAHSRVRFFLLKHHGLAGFFVHELYDLGIDAFNKPSWIGYVFFNRHVDTKESSFGTLFK